MGFPMPTTLLAILSPSCPSCNDNIIIAGFASFCFSISNIFLLAGDNCNHRHYPSERALAFLVYPIDTATDFHLLIYTYFLLLQLAHPRLLIDW
jgi:hypothetical protein